ncbi:hypothetical protein [Maritimibacter dapengensis]|uniref:Uncharacterized protein n=1 Tax=Maritimibacter dapengensis TaxID=2836868 RepID=A0ABS6T1Y9_9RHOB|nr:hypothetical protein [Maritimibacter dapengensis]MBV7378392.1 hypothetical protein [Maritimibacter dapengensis]
MDMQQVSQYARSLYDAHGDKAEAEAAAKMRACAEAGKNKEAEDWQSVRASIRALRGANQS